MEEVYPTTDLFAGRYRPSDAASAIALQHDEWDADVRKAVAVGQETDASREWEEPFLQSARYHGELSVESRRSGVAIEYRLVPSVTFDDLPPDFYREREYLAALALLRHSAFPYELDMLSDRCRYAFFDRSDTDHAKWLTSSWAYLPMRHRYDAELSASLHLPWDELPRRVMTVETIEGLLGAGEDVVIKPTTTLTLRRRSPIR